MSFIPIASSIGGHNVHLHHQAPACRPDFGVGRHRLDGRGRTAGFDLGGVRLHPDRASCATGSTSPPPDRRPGHRCGRRDRLRHRRLQPDPRHQRRHPRRSLLRRRRQRQGNVNTTNSKVHQIGEKPFDGTQHGRAILYINGASGTISGNKVYDFQKNGIEVRGVNADASAPSSHKTSATIANNVITGQGPIDYIAQNGIVILGNATATVKDNTVSHLWYTPDGTEATGLLNSGRRQDHGVGQQVRRHRGAHRRRGDRERPGRLDHDGPRARRPHRPPQLREAGRPGHARHQARLEDHGRRQHQAAHQAGLQRAHRLLRALQAAGTPSGSSRTASSSAGSSPRF